MSLSSLLITRNPLIGFLTGAALLVSWCCAQAAPQIKTVAPANVATGVSPAAPVVFTFTEAMNTALTSATFMDGMSFLSATAAWSDGNKVLTCSPSPAWPVGHMVVWMVDGENPSGQALDGDTAGVFTPAAASTGCDTNAPMLSFTVSKGWSYTQTSAATPALSTNYPYCFLACMTLPCPRSATNVTLQLPTGPVQSMVLSSIPGHLTLQDCSYANPSLFEAAYPPGNYTFTVQAASSNQPVTVNLPSNLAQPSAPPHLTNYLAAQSINPAQPFVLGWEPFPGGTAQDCIYVEIYGGAFQTPAVGMAGALNGTATSVTIPGGTLQPNSQYSGCVTFYHYQMYTNGSSHVSLVYRASTTEFSLHTGAGSAYCPAITNAGWAAAGTFKFEVACPIGQALVAEWRTNLQAGQWQTLCSTNSPVTRVRFTDPAAAANARLFYRVRTGP
jgi:hypothetical protein